jgi:hypothetical protein
MSTKQNNYQWHGEDIAENGTENQTKTKQTLPTHFSPSTNLLPSLSSMRI